MHLGLQIRAKQDKGPLATVSYVVTDSTYSGTGKAGRVQDVLSVHSSLAEANTAAVLAAASTAPAPGTWFDATACKMPSTIASDGRRTYVCMARCLSTRQVARVIRVCLVTLQTGSTRCTGTV